MYKILYVIFFFCASVLSMQHYLGLPLTPRQLAAVLMFFVCIIEEKKIWCDKLFYIYAFFIICYGISSLISGFFSYFLLRLFGDYFVAFVALWAIKILIVKYNALDVFLYAFIAIGFFDGMVTLCQFLGLSYLDSIVSKFQLISYDPYLRNYFGTETAMLLNCPPGIFSHPVLNAHALAACTVLSTYVAYKKNRIIGTVVSLIMLVFLFSTQQRTAFAIALLSVGAIVFILSMRTKYRSIIIPCLMVGAVLVCMGLYTFIMRGDYRFTELGLDSTGRDSIYKICKDFIIHNPMGGINLFLEQADTYPHNLAFNALIFGGWIGGLALIYIVLLQLLEIFKTLRNKKEDIVDIILALAFFSLTVNGLSHNQSIVNGEIMTWTVWGAFYYTKKKEEPYKG